MINRAHTAAVCSHHGGKNDQLTTRAVHPYPPYSQKSKPRTWMAFPNKRRTSIGGARSNNNSVWRQLSLLVFLGSLGTVGLLAWKNRLHGGQGGEQRLNERTRNKSGIGGSNGSPDYSFDSNQSLYNQGNHHRTQPFGKHPLRMLLRKAGYSLDDMTNVILQQKLKQLPTWEELVQDFRIDEPRIIGLETCAQFQSMEDDPAEHMIGVAGTFNSGTNLLAELLWQNCYMVARVQKHGPTQRGIRWQVPYGKHSPVDDEVYRQVHKAQNEQAIETNQVLPIVTIRDPYIWMSSMCRHAYQMSWPTSHDHHCPNLVPSPNDAPILRGLSSIPVRVQYGDDKERRHFSMVHHYNEWYGAYWNATWPRLMVRYEDLLFHPRTVTEQICRCAGGKLLGNRKIDDSEKLGGGGDENGKAEEESDNGDEGDEKDKDDSDDENDDDPDTQTVVPFRYVKESAKDNSAVHGDQKTGLLEAMLQYSRTEREAIVNHHMTAQDRAFAQTTLDPNLLRLFHYHAKK